MTKIVKTGTPNSRKLAIITERICVQLRGLEKLDLTDGTDAGMLRDAACGALREAAEYLEQAGDLERNAERGFDEAVQAATQMAFEIGGEDGPEN